MVEDNENLPLAQRRPHRLNRLLPKRFRDDPPKPLPCLPPVLDIATNPPVGSTSAADPESSSVTEGLCSRVRRLFSTPRNSFGLWRQYNTKELPSHDPEEHVGSDDLFDNESQAEETPARPSDTHNPFQPFPNKNSFLLGEWYWNEGIQKSQASFRKLLEIVGDAEFRPEDVRHSRWKQIDNKLCWNDFDGADSEADEADWLNDDARWNRTPISISVPFHQRMKKPGPQTYLVGDLYHRTLVSVIVEKLKNRHDNRHFHYDGFELFWRPTEHSADTRVYGELYTSPAFLDAQREIQDSPGEPGCSLPRVVVALMFASDATQLTSFGSAKLWPCYLFIGNESKYRRCKPSCNLCNHVAYFQTVSCFCVQRA